MSRGWLDRRSRVPRNHFYTAPRAGVIVHRRHPGQDLVRESPWGLVRCDLFENLEHGPRTLLRKRELSFGVHAIGRRRAVLNQPHVRPIYERTGVGMILHPFPHRHGSSLDFALYVNGVGGMDGRCLGLRVRRQTSELALETAKKPLSRWAVLRVVISRPRAGFCPLTDLRRAWSCHYFGAK